MSHLRKSALVFAALLALSGCKTDLYAGLSQRDANEMAAALMQAGIPTERRTVKAGEFTIRVDEAHFAQAKQVLETRGLPRERFKEFGEIFAGDSFIPTPTEERARLIYARNQELSRTVSEIEGVIRARVHLVLPERDPLAREVRPASASVTIHYAPTVDVEGLAPRIKLLIANSVEGLAYERVSVAFFPYTGLGGASVGGAAPQGVMAASVGAPAPAAEPKRAMSLMLAIGAALLGALALTFQTGSRRRGGSSNGSGNGSGNGSARRGAR